MAAYATSKMGVVGLTRALALEGAPLGITVNVIAPSAKTRPGGFGPIPASPRLHEWMSLDQVAALGGVARARRLHDDGRVLLGGRRLHGAGDLP